MNPVTISDVRNHWTDVLSLVDRSPRPVLIHRMRPGRPNEQQAVPALAAFAPTLYEHQLTARFGDNPPPVVDLYPIDSTRLAVDWTPAEGAQRVSLDARRARGRLAEVVRRIENDRVHVMVFHRSVAPPTLVIAFTPLDFTDLAQPDHPDQRSPATPNPR